MSSKYELDRLQASIDIAREDYLRRFGWRLTCNTPGAFWLWTRDFGDMDTRRLARWDGATGPYGKASKPVPMGVMTVPADIAVSMTKAELDTDTDEAET